MKYNFDDLADRSNTNSVKYSTPGVLPMWVADMDYKTPDFVLDVIKERVNKGCFGYTEHPNYFYESIIDFYKRNHSIEIKRDDMIFTQGVVPAISSAVRELTNDGDNVLILSPVYNMFYSSILDNNRNALECKLTYNDGIYDIDYDDLDNKLRETKLFIFCNPHNPIGKLWTKEEINKIAKLCIKHNVMVISDEIHSDIVTPGMKTYSFLNITDLDVIMLSSASKSFNLAGLQGSFMVCYNHELLHRLEHRLDVEGQTHGNALVYDALSKAFSDGDNYLSELNEYIYNNKLYVENFIKEEIKDLTYIKGDATYLVWVDVSKVTDNVKRFTAKLKRKYKLWVSSGDTFGSNGAGFIRINLATSHANVVEGMNRLKKAVEDK